MEDNDFFALCASLVGRWTIKKFRFLSWGLGVQSTWLLVMAGLGEIEPIDAAIVADTQWERKKTGEIFQFYREWAEEHNIHVEVVTAGSVRLLGAAEHLHIPFYTDTGAPLTRQCTNHFKLIPLKRGMRRLAGFHETKIPHPKSGQFEVLIGISWDEWNRMNESRIKFMTNRYPLVEKHINRWDCETGFRKLGLPVPIKSACIGCPFRQAIEWLNMQRNDPDDFRDAVEFDKENRNNPLADRGSTSDKLYVWKGLIPLSDVDFEAESKKQKRSKQTPMFVCTGNICWT